MSDIKKVVVAGGGVLGSQIALQTAYWGYDVTIWLRMESSIGRCQPKLDKFEQQYLEAIEGMKGATGADDPAWCAGIANFDSFDADECASRVHAAHDNMKLELDLGKAVADADLVIESMAEVASEKAAFFEKVAPLMPEKTIIVTNSSSLLPSQFTKDTGRPDRYLALHFANSIWKHNVTEVMVQGETSDESFQAVLDFARGIHMDPLPVRKEKAGYLLNSQLVPWMLSGLDLLANGISDPQSIDKAWTSGTGAPKGPFQVFDTVGLTTAMNIVEQYQKVPGIINPLLKRMMLPYNFKGMKAVLQKYIDEGKLGMAAGEGFYKYDGNGDIIRQ